MQESLTSPPPNFPAENVQLGNLFWNPKVNVNDIFEKALIESSIIYDISYFSTLVFYLHTLHVYTNRLT